MSVYEVRELRLPEAQAEISDRQSLLVIGHDFSQREQKGFYQALGGQFDLEIRLVDNGWPESIEEVKDYERFDAVMWYVRFRELRARPAFNWAQFKGWRIMYDEDAYLNSRPIRSEGHKLVGAWPEVVRKHEFDRLVCTGKVTCDQLKAEGVNAHWIPKGFEGTRIFDKRGERSGLCFFGVKYDARRAMLRHLDREKVEYSQFSCHYDDLNEHLNKYLGCLMCNQRVFPDKSSMGGIRYFFSHTRGLTRLLPLLKDRGMALGPGVEPMIKNFEVPGAGCVPFCDWMDELEDLGFVDGLNAVTYTNFDELTEKIHHYQANPDELSIMGKRAHELAHRDHTWDVRARTLAELLKERRS